MQVVYFERHPKKLQKKGRRLVKQKGRYGQSVKITKDIITVNDWSLIVPENNGRSSRICALEFSQPMCKESRGIFPSDLGWGMLKKNVLF